MKESKFIAKNKEKWQHFEQMISNKENDPDQLSDLFIEINEDTSFANTFFKNRIISRYLNKLSVRLYSKIFSHLKMKHGFKFFWKEELPYIIYQSRKEINLCVILLLAGIALGVISSIANPDFCREILGDYYVNMTEEFIESGDPMKVYKQRAGDSMFFSIAINNLRVSFLTFVSGIFAGIGSLVVIAYNAVMVGAFQFFFIERGLFQESFLTIWMHGAIEISLIAIEGAAGLVLGKGLILPGNLPRNVSFKRSAKRGVKLLIGSMPLIVLAAIIESFLTRFTEIPDIIRLLFIISSFGLVGFIFFYNPRRLAKRGFHPDAIAEDEIRTGQFVKPKRADSSIRTNKEVFSKSFELTIKGFKKARTFILVLCVLASSYVGYQYWENNEEIELFDTFRGGFFTFFRIFWGGSSDGFTYDSDPVVMIINALMILGSALAANKILGKSLVPNTSSLLFLLPYAAALAYFMQLNTFSVFLCLMTAPYFLTASAIMLQQHLPLGQALGKAWRHFKKSFFKQLFLYSIISFLYLLLLTYIQSTAFLFIQEFISPFLFTKWGYATSFALTVSTFMFYTLSALFYITLYVSCYVNYFSLEEITTAKDLKAKINQL